MKRPLVVSLTVSVALHLVALVLLLVLFREDTLDRVLFVHLNETPPAPRRPASVKEPVRPVAQRPRALRELAEGASPGAPAHEPLQALEPPASAEPAGDTSSSLTSSPDRAAPTRDSVVPPAVLPRMGSREREPETATTPDSPVRASQEVREGATPPSPVAGLVSASAIDGVRRTASALTMGGPASTSEGRAASAGTGGASISATSGPDGDAATAGPGPGRGSASTAGSSLPSGGVLASAVPGSGSGGDGEYAGYYALLRRRLQEALRYPPAARRSGVSGTVELRVVITPDGTVSSVTVAKSSSHRILDEAALEAARRLPRIPFPDGLTPREVDATLPIVFNLRR